VHRDAAMGTTLAYPISQPELWQFGTYVGVPDVCGNFT
jgi:hypothetical protein